MGRRQPWQVLYKEQRNASSRTRSFFDETTALAWAQGLVRARGEEASAWVVLKDYPGEELDSFGPSHHVVISNGELLTRSWPAQTREEAAEQSRRAISEAMAAVMPTGSVRAVRDVPDRGPRWVLGTEQGLRVLPDKPGSKGPAPGE